ncbi:MAG TPA: sigma-70 family RNA polymerase sigma factor [Membranihabitans sp.]|nr:sigma-70 family RNA polymerase sigma factor [Membranihabitans sp.]
MNSEVKENDDVLVLRLSGDDRAAFHAIFEKYWAPLYSKAFQRLQDEASAKDVVQNVFTSLWHRRREVEISNLKSYLFSAVRYQVFKQVSQSNKHSAFFDPFEMMMVSPIRTDQDLIRDDLAQLLIAWIDTLPRKRRQIFVMHYQEQLSVSEIAVKLGITRKTVYNQLNNSIKELQWKLAKYTLLWMLIGIF